MRVATKLLLSLLLAITVSGTAFAAPTTLRVRHYALAGMHIRFAAPAVWWFHYQRGLESFRPYHGRYTLQGLFYTVTFSHGKTFPHKPSGFVLAFLQDPQKLTVAEYVDDYLGGQELFNLAASDQRIGNADEVYTAHGNAQTGNQAFFMRFGTHMYWLAWSRGSTLRVRDMAQYLRFWQFTR